jgi:hypothetical protein
VWGLDEEPPLVDPVGIRHVRRTSRRELRLPSSTGIDRNRPDVRPLHEA